MTITGRDPADEALFANMRAAFADTEMHVPVAGIHVRARTRRRRTALAVALIVAVILAGVTAGTGLVTRRSTSPAGVPPLVAGFDAACHRAWNRLGPGRGAVLGGHLPPLVLILAAGTPGALVYGDKTGSGDVLCERKSSGEVDIAGGRSTNTARGFPYPVEDLLGQDGSDGVGGDPDPGYVYGRMPRGVTRIDLHLDDGRTVRATLGDGYYGFVSPHRRGAVDQTVVHEAGGFYAMAFPAPPPGSHIDHPTCEQSITWMLASMIDLSPAQRAAHPQLIYYTPGGHDVSYYAADRIFLQCLDGSQLIAWFPDQPFSATPDALSIVLHDPGLFTGWVAGKAPADAQRAVVRLADGRRIEAALSQGFYFAEFDVTNPGVVSVTAYTASGAQTTGAPN